MNSNYYENDYENDLQPSDAALLCSLMCFIPWGRFVSLSPDDGSVETTKSTEITMNLPPFTLSSSKYNEITSNGQEIHTTTAGSTTSTPLSCPSSPSPSSNLITSNENGWSVFHSRRKNTLDDSIHSMDWSSPRSLFQRSPTIFMRKQNQHSNINSSSHHHTPVSNN